MSKRINSINLTEEWKDNISKSNMGNVLISGEKNGKSIITEADAIDIRLRVLEGEGCMVVCRDYPQYSVSACKHVYSCRSWKYLPNTIQGLKDMKKTCKYN